jgi:hypothetical protein
MSGRSPIKAGLLVLATIGWGACEETSPDASTAGEILPDAGDTRCPGTRQAVAHETVLASGFTPAQVLAFTAGEHSAPLDWSRGDDSHGPNTRLFLSFLHPQAHLVAGDAHAPSTARNLVCLEHVAVTGQAHLATEDGQFDEVASLTLDSPDGLHATGILTLSVPDLAGTYAQQFHDSDRGSDECLISLRFGFEMAPGDFTGEFVQAVALAPCDEVHAATPVTTRGGGWWGRKSFQATPDAGF